ncbi:MAG: T9SS type A sorting domain-containing protein [Taibaiella sp.]|nr:T9SS type A sorting domain-containing protein [Taibaiella sp.]
MKNTLLVIFLLTSSILSATGQVIDGIPVDSTIITFRDTAFNLYYTGDTTSMPLWQIGKTHKSFFTSDTNGVIAIMTDTLNHYPVNADNYFILDLPDSQNTIIGFWHHYETDSGKDGGTVEYSVDGGLTWENIVSDCHVEEASPLYGICTDNFYGANDTLANGIPAFSGTRHSQFSRLQLYKAIPVVLAFPSECPERAGLLRFRFISDTTADTLAGWMIDSIKIEYDNYYFGGSVHSVLETSTISPFPNPSKDGKILFPEIIDDEKFTLSIRDQLGSIILTRPYTRDVDLSFLPPNLYFFTVSDGQSSYSGKIVLDN